MSVTLLDGDPTGRRVLFGQLIRFGIVGCTNTLVSWCAYALLVRSGVPVLVASALAWVLGALNSYVQNRRWTFRSRARCAPELARFGAVQCVGLLLDLAALHALVDAGVDRLVAQALVYPLITVLTFLASRRWAFATVGPTQGWAS